MFAAESGHKEVVSALLAKGATVDLKNEVGVTALIIAAINGRKEVVSALLAKGADVNLTNAGGTTALMLATHFGHKEVVSVLLKKAVFSGANLSGVDLSGVDLSEANLSKANLSKANLSGANLSGANLLKANLSRANLSGANLENTFKSSDNATVTEAVIDAAAVKSMVKDIKAPNHDTIKNHPFVKRYLNSNGLFLMEDKNAAPSPNTSTSARPDGIELIRIKNGSKKTYSFVDANPTTSPQNSDKRYRTLQQASLVRPR